MRERKNNIRRRGKGGNELERKRAFEGRLSGKGSGKLPAG